MLRRKSELTGRRATAAVAGMIGVLFAGSTLVTPLYIIYEERFGFSAFTLTLVYATYVVGNLAALFLFGRLSDRIGRRRTALPAIGIGVISVLVFLSATHTVSLFVARVLSGLCIGIGAGTGTAWLTELIGKDDKAPATTVATSANYAGLGLGALVSGLLAQYAPGPLHVPFIVYLVCLVALALLIWRTPETTGRSRFVWRDILLPTRISVPQRIRAAFVAPAVAGFGSMALTGYYAALEPSILAHNLHVTSHAVAGAMFFELAIVVSVIIVLTQRVPSRIAMLWALALMLPSAAMVVAAQAFGSMPTMIAATALCGIAAGLGYRGSLQVVNEIAPEDQRAEVVSSYFVCAFAGNALPVIGVGGISTLASATAASLIFAVMIGAFALVALFLGIKYRR